MEGLSAALSAEVGPLGIRVHLLELGGFATDWAGSSMRFTTADPAYEGTRTAILGMPAYPTPDEVEAAASEPQTEESPRVAAEALLALLDEPEPPLRKVIGTGAHDMVRMALEWRRDDYLRDPAFVWPG